MKKYSAFVTGLPAVTTVGGADLFAVVQGGVAKKATGTQVGAGAGGGNAFVTLADDSTIIAATPGAADTFYLVTTQSDRMYIYKSGNWYFFTLNAIVPQG